MNADTRWWRRPRAVDIAIAVGAAAVLALLTVIAMEEGSTAPDAVAYALAGLVGVVLLWRRRFPTGVAMVSLVLIFAYHALGYPALGNLPLAFAILNASYQGAAPAASGVAALAVLGSLGWFLVGESRPPSEAFNFIVRESGIMAAVILTGSVLRSRRLLAEETQERIRLARADEEARAERRRTEERMGIAREIHDVVAHTVALIGVQARAAADSFQDDPEEAEKALRIIGESTREATAELQATIGVLREGDPSPSPAPGLDELKALVDSVSAGGPEVQLRTAGDRPPRLSALAQLVTYRVAQEALTNVVKHSGATHARVDVTFRRGEVRLTVSDDGIGGEATEGHGITGMRERVEATGGDLSAGPSPEGGFVVSARIPTGTEP